MNMMGPGAEASFAGGLCCWLLAATYCRDTNVEYAYDGQKSQAVAMHEPRVA